MTPVNLGLISALAMALAGCASAPATPPAGTPTVVLRVAAANMAFDQSTLVVPADATFAMDFANRDGVPHNVSIRGAPSRMTGDVVTGPGSRTYLFGPLPTGSYTFVCDVHPAMTGVISAVSTGS
jgi:plastocyanin